MKTTVTTVTYTCDLCLAIRQETGWPLDGYLRFKHGLQDFQGSVVAGYEREWQLCDNCVNRVRDAINNLTRPEETS